MRVCEYGCDEYLGDPTGMGGVVELTLALRGICTYYGDDNFFRKKSVKLRKFTLKLRVFWPKNVCCVCGLIGSVKPSENKCDW